MLNITLSHVGKTGSGAECERHTPDGKIGEATILHLGAKKSAEKIFNTTLVTVGKAGDKPSHSDGHTDHVGGPLVGENDHTTHARDNCNLANLSSNNTTPTTARVSPTSVTVLAPSRPPPLKITIKFTMAPMEKVEDPVEGNPELWSDAIL